MGDAAVDESELMLRQCLAREPKSKDALVGLAQVLAARHDLNGAERQFGLVLELQANNADAIYGMASICFKKGDPRGAEALCRRVVAAHLPHPAPRHNC